MQQDPYYTLLYHAKKQYYATREDIVTKKAGMKGWKGWVDNLAKRWLLKLLIGHAVQIIREHEQLPFNAHHNYIPPKPTDYIGNEPWFLRILELLKSGAREWTLDDTPQR